MKQIVWIRFTRGSCYHFQNKIIPPLHVNQTHSYLLGFDYMTQGSNISLRVQLHLFFNCPWQPH